MELQSWQYCQFCVFVKNPNNEILRNYVHRCVQRLQKTSKNRYNMSCFFLYSVDKIRPFGLNKNWWWCFNSDSNVTRVNDRPWWVVPNYFFLQLHFTMQIRYMATKWNMLLIDLTQIKEMHFDHVSILISNTERMAHICRHLPNVWP